MSNETAHLALMLDAPMQSWGFASRFQRRTTGLHPTKSGVVGMICAAMGLAKGSADEGEMLPRLARLKMSSISIPCRRSSRWTDKTEDLPALRLEDFHTVLDTRRASGKMNDDPVVTRRQYLLDARFGVILSGERTLLEHAAAALKDPVWGVWFGRKCCIPAEPVCRGVFAAETDARRELIGDVSLETLTTVTEAENFAAGTDSIDDQPVSFGDGKSSGPDARRFAPRRINLIPGSIAP